MRPCSEPSARARGSEDFLNHQQGARTDQKIPTVRRDRLQAGERVGVPTFQVPLEVGFDHFRLGIFRGRKVAA
jgi:hypothetical protein